MSLWFISYIVNSSYLTERGELVKRIAAVKADLENIREAKLDQRRIDAEHQSYIDRTLGGDLETVDHKLRSRLSRLVEHAELQNKSVGPTGGARTILSPAKSVFRGAQRELGEDPDFVELECPVSGVGTLEQVLKLIDSIEAEPWIKRIDELRLDPSDNGAKVRVDLRLTTLFMPQRKPSGNGSAMTVSAPRTERFAALVSHNPFRVPPPSPNPPPDKPATAGPAEFQYGQWQVTGIAQTAVGPEVWLRNAQGKQTKYLNVGDKLHEMVFVRTDGETAEFQLGVQRFSIAVGKNLNDRTPVNH